MSVKRIHRRVCLLFLVSGWDVPSTRFRVLSYLPLLDRHGFRMEVCAGQPHKYASSRNLFIKSALTAAKVFGRLPGLAQAHRSDLVFLERELVIGTTPLLEWATGILNRRILFDFDDALFVQSPAGVARVCRMARAVLAGNDYLAQFARRHNSNVHVVPTPIDTNRFMPLPEKPQSRILLVWTGTSSNHRYLKCLEAPLREVLRRFPQTGLRIISDRPPADLEVFFEFCPWDEDTEVRALRECHIGLMPLIDSEWARGKCGFKIIQYMSTGIPSVASPVGTNPWILEDGVTGFLADTPEEWIAGLTRLIGNRELRHQMGLEARRCAVERYSVDVIFQKFLAAVNSAL